MFLKIAAILFLFNSANADENCTNLFWEPSAKVKQIIRLSKNDQLIQLSPNVHVDLELQIIQPRKTYDKSATIAAATFLNWKAWLEAHFAQEAVSSYIEAIGYLEQMFGQPFHSLVNFGIQMNPSKRGSVLYGFFRVTGTWRLVAEALDKVDFILGSPPEELPPTPSLGVPLKDGDV